jgi:hypothetical protein
MVDNNCDQQALDLGWDLVRETYCHIGVLNNEMGGVLTRLDRIEDFVALNLWIWGIVGATVIALVVKKMWGNGSTK